MTLGSWIRRKRSAVLGLTALLAAAGLWAASKLPLAIFPEVGFHRIQIIARAGSLPVDQTLTTLTEPIEAALSGVLGLQMIRSKTTRGGAEIDLRFTWNQDMARALQLVLAAADEARGTLPAGTEIETRELDSSAFPIVGVAVSSPTRSLGEVSDLVLYEAAPQIRRLPGVYRVELAGAKLREYVVEVDPAALVAHRLQIADVEAAVRGSSLVTAAGRIGDGYQLALAAVSGRGTSAGALLDAVVATDHGVPVRLRSVARLEAAVREDFTRAAANGTESVLIGVSRQPTGNALDVSGGVRERVAALARAHPELRFSVFYDQADLVADAVASVREAIAIGLVLAVATVFFFIADVRTTVVAAAVIPVTLLITCLVLHLLGMSLNLMTLGGIAAGIGLVLDDAIVVVENFHRHHRAGATPEDAIAASTSEIGVALVGSTMTPIAVLLPLAALGEVPGAFFRPLAVTMSVALSTSLALALSFTPALTAALERGPRRRIRGGPGDRLAEHAARLYGRLLAWMLRHRGVALAIALAIVAVASTAYRHLETGFVPEMDEGAFILDYWSPPGTSVDETVRLLAPVDATLRETPEVTAFSRRTGAELGFFLTETNRGDYAVRLRRGARRSVAAVMAEVRGKLAERAPGVRVELLQILQDMLGDLSGEPSPIELKLFGKDLEALEAAARRSAEIIGRIPGVVDVYDGLDPLGPTVRMTLDETAAGRAGFSAESVAHVLETAIQGSVAGQVLEGDRAIPIRVQYPPALRAGVDGLGALDLVSPRAAVVPMRAILRLEEGPAAIAREREDLRQVVRVTAHLEGRDLGSAVAEVRARIAGELRVPPGVTLEYGGLYASQQRAFADLAAVLAAAGGAVGALLLVEFGSIAAALAIVVGSSLALCGSLLALWATATPLNVSSVVGMVMVIGIVAKNGILLLDFAERERSAGASHEDALLAAGRTRLRPILMTSIAAVAGLAPLALGLGAGGEMQQPLAIAILGGVSLSMLFSLIGVPLLDAALRGRRKVSS